MSGPLRDCSKALAEEKKMAVYDDPANGNGAPAAPYYITLCCCRMCNEFLNQVLLLIVMNSGKFGLLKKKMTLPLPAIYPLRKPSTPLPE